SQHLSGYSLRKIRLRLPSSSVHLRLLSLLWDSPRTIMTWLDLSSMNTRNLVEIMRRQSAAGRIKKCLSACVIISPQAPVMDGSHAPLGLLFGTLVNRPISPTGRLLLRAVGSRLGCSAG